MTRSTEQIIAAEKTARFIPAPCCHGKGGEYEPVGGMWESGPYYPCAGCGDTGNMADYVRLEAERKEKFAQEDAVTCVCGHKAWEHYEAFGDPFSERCAWVSSEADNDGRLAVCDCKMSREMLTPKPRKTPEDAGLGGRSAEGDYDA